MVTLMAASYTTIQTTIQFSPYSSLKIKSSSDAERNNAKQISTRKRCLRCNTRYHDKENCPTACFFLGHTTGKPFNPTCPTTSLLMYEYELFRLSIYIRVYIGIWKGNKGLFALAPPHQGIDGEWTDQSGVIVYKWNEKGDRPNTGRPNWKRRWSCCQEYEQEAPPCRRGWHVSYDDGFTLM